MYVRQDVERIRICELMKFNLEQIGVRCNVQPLENTVLVQRMQENKYQAYYGGWGAGSDPDMSENVWRTKFMPPEGRNYLRYSNPDVDKLFEEGKREFDREKRAKIYAKINQLIYNDQPCTFLFYRNAFYGFNKQLRGYYFSPRGPYHYGPGFSSVWKAAN
jgi:peptide/nickel transport system substrate-binding protein